MGSNEYDYVSFHNYIIPYFQTQYGQDLQNTYFFLFWPQIKDRGHKQQKSAYRVQEIKLFSGRLFVTTAIAILWSLDRNQVKGTSILASFF